MIDYNLDDLVSEAKIILNKQFSNDIVSLSAVGSRVYGCNSPSSDLDLHLVLDSNFKNYYYHSFDVNNIDTNVLVISRNTLNKNFSIYDSNDMSLAPLYGPCFIVKDDNDFLKVRRQDFQKKIFNYFFEEFSFIAGMVPSNYKIRIPLSTMVQWPIVKIAMLNPSMADRFLRAQDFNKLESWICSLSKTYNHVIDLFINGSLLEKVDDGSEMIDKVYDYKGERISVNASFLIEKQFFNMVKKFPFISAHKFKMGVSFYKSHNSLKKCPVNYFKNLVKYYLMHFEAYKSLFRIYSDNYSTFSFNHDDKIATYQGVTMKSIVENDFFNKVSSRERSNIKFGLVDSQNIL